MLKYYYLDISLNTEGLELTEAFYKQHIINSVTTLFGTTGATIPIDLLKYEPSNFRAIIRVSTHHYVKVRAALTLGLHCQGSPAQFYIHKASPILLALQGDSREMTEKFKINSKDWVIFATKENHMEASTIKLSKPDPQPGLILDNGDINWNCPCLGGMATGPCGVEFREAFSCFHYSNAEPKGSDCFEKFKDMQTCMQRYPKLYDKDMADDDDMTEAIEKSERESQARKAAAADASTVAKNATDKAAGSRNNVV